MSFIDEVRRISQYQNCLLSLTDVKEKILEKAKSWNNFIIIHECKLLNVSIINYLQEEGFKCRKAERCYEGGVKAIVYIIEW